MVEVGAVTVTRRGRHEQHEWHFRNTWRQALCDLCLRLTLWHAIHVCECINLERGQYCIRTAGMNLSGIASQFAMQNLSFAMRN